MSEPALKTSKRFKVLVLVPPHAELGQHRTVQAHRGAFSTSDELTPIFKQNITPKVVAF